MIEEYDGVVYDLDGTLVQLDVDWGDVRHEVEAVLRARGLDCEGASLWDLLETAEQEGLARRVQSVIAEHERKGARTASRLPTAETIPTDRPVAVCSLNAHSACRIALERQGLDGRIDAVVGRDSLDTYKPDPAPLLWAIDQLDLEPTAAVFVGDGQRDAETASRAGVDFRYVDEL